MKSICFLFIIFLISCSPVKIKDFNNDYTQELVGQIKSMDMRQYEYKFIKKDTVNLVQTITLNFDSNNRIKNEKIITENGQKAAIYQYLNGLLIEKQLLSTHDSTLVTYKYDQSKNLIEEKATYNNGMFNLKSQVFDKYHNVVQIRTNFVKKINQLTEIEYNYKNNYFIAKSTIDTIAVGTIETKNHFNKKGYIIKSQRNNQSINSKYYRYDIDKNGNLTTKTYYKANNTVIEIVTFKNTYDKKGNIIIRERFLNGKLISKTTYDITYT